MGWRKPVLVLALGVTVAGAATGFVYLRYRAAPAVMAQSAGPNAVWAAHRWVGAAQPAAAYDRLVGTLRANRISDVFFHVGPLAADGTIDPARFPNAGTLVAEIKRRAPGLRLQVWIGQREARGGGPLDLGNAAVRGRIVTTAGRFLGLGFDGIHYNFEPLFDGDRRLLALLDATAALTGPRDRVLSVATYEVEPLPGSGRLIDLAFPEASLWSRAYYGDVARRVDQVAVMLYDTALPRRWLFAAFAAHQTAAIRQAVGGRATLFIGVPTYEERRWNFDPAAENLQSALAGVGHALDGAADAPPDFGLAVYANWTTDGDEWALWRRGWLGLDDNGLDAAVRPSVIGNFGEPVGAAADRGQVE